MNPVSAVVIYIVIWWMVLFMVLPFGIRRADDLEPGEDAGAPANPRLVRKAIVTTVVATLIFVGFSWAVNTGVINLFGNRAGPQ